jgi:endonuclease/exonuclease/phosphatase family metal-dependent hydrolase
VANTGPSGLAEQPVAGRLTVATLNTRGIAPAGSLLPARYAAIAASFQAGDADVVCFQEVVTYWHLRLLARRMSSFQHVSYRPSVAGPAGGLVTFSRLPVTRTAFHGFGVPPKAPGISRSTRLRAGPKGTLVTLLPRPGVAIINTHPLPNKDGDWSPAGRYYPLHRIQLAALASVAGDVPGPVVVCGDFNVDRDSSLFAGFVRDTGLADAFNGECPPTFRAEYLPAGATLCCIDFILAGAGITAEATGLLFAEKASLPGGPGYVSDHLGLSARLSLPPPHDERAAAGRLP